MTTESEAWSRPLRFPAMRWRDEIDQLHMFFEAYFLAAESSLGRALVLQTDEVTVATYVEHHELRDRDNHRLSTGVFVADSTAPNGLLWLRVHETRIT